MTFSISTVKLINILFIAAGIGVCGLCFLQITSSTHLRKEVRRYFQVFFLVLVLYIGTHLARELMDGLPGAGVSAALRIVTFVEVLSAGGLAFLMSMLILSVAILVLLVFLFRETGRKKAADLLRKMFRRHGKESA